MESRDGIRRFATPWKVEEENSEMQVVTDAMVRRSRGLIIAQPAPDTVWVRSGLRCSDKLGHQFRWSTPFEPAEKTAQAGRISNVPKRYAQRPNLAANRFVDIKKSGGISGRQWRLPKADRKPIPSL
jgi:hypothetical protein